MNRVAAVGPCRCRWRRFPIGRSTTGHGAARLSSADGKIVILTGAGISAAIGIATFRVPGALWAGHRMEDV